MVNMTLSVPEEVRESMKEFPEINWSVVARVAIVNRIKMLRKFKDFNVESDMTEDDAVELGRRLKRKR